MCYWSLSRQCFCILVFIFHRIHAEFQLNEAPYYPFWFTPAQFTGNLIVSRDFKKMLSLTAHVPADKKLNVGELH